MTNICSSYQHSVDNFTGEMKNKYIPPDHFDRILRASFKEDRALWILSSETGFRIDDILHIRQWQVPSESACRHGGQFSLTIREQKTGNVRTVALSERAQLSLAEIWLHQPKRHKLAYLFPTRRQERCNNLHRSTVTRHFAEAVRKAGLEGEGYTVHSLRKIYARNRYACTKSMLDVQRDLGHKSLATTLLYLNDLEL